MSSLSEELVEISEQGVSAVLATIVEVDGNSRVEPGAKCLVRDGKVTANTIDDANLIAAIVQESEARLRDEQAKLVSLDIPAAGGKFEVFFELMLVPPKLVVVGAGHIAVPLVKMAKVLDFHVTVIDDRLMYANRERFPDADEVVVSDMAQSLKGMTITSSTYIVLITRGHKYDEPCLREIIHSPAKYIGMIGSKRRIKACFRRFRDEERIAEEVIERVYAPIGLDIATETPAEIALSILAEMIKVRRGGKAASLSGHPHPNRLAEGEDRVTEKRVGTTS
jgi:xanthine dehydrogenase accessory factor